MTNEQPTTQPAPKPAPAPAPAPAESTDDAAKRGPGVPADKIEFDVDDEAGTVSTTVGGVGWPEGAENEEGTQADGTKAESE